MFGKTLVDGCVVVGTDEDHCDPACFSIDYRYVVGCCGGEAHA